jgi:hypothetical protein
VRWLVRLFDVVWQPRAQATPSPEIDQMAVRDEMTRDDPDFALARDALHEARQVETLKKNHDAYHDMLRRSWGADRGHG